MNEIPLNKEIDKFKLHLENNPRVIFSAQFGDGKTHFLRKFIEATRNDTCVLTLYPLKYSIAPNENIMEYIKRDILIQLADYGIYETIDFDAFADSLFSLENTVSLVNFLVSALPGGELVSKLVSKGVKLKKDYDEKKHSLNKYKESFTLQSGGIYERDAYTKLIEATVARIKEGGKRTVLLIEGLDRIDPNHLFRILNVLGAHIDEDAESNKFGFDNIVVVLDFRITEHIFHHFYGEDANYHGYISKFVSHYPYEYSITTVAREYLLQFIEDNCGLGRIECDKFEFQVFPERTSLSSAVNRLSVRDIVKCIDGFEQQYIVEDCELETGAKIRSDQKIVKLLALLKRMQLPISGGWLLHGITRLEGGAGLNLLGGYLARNIDVRKGYCIRYDNSLWKLYKVLSPDGVPEYCFRRVSGGPIAEISMNNEVNAILDIAARYVRDLILPA